MKQAQISMFIIIAIVVLLASAFAFYLVTTSGREEIAPGVFISLTELPTELDPVEAFVTSCLEAVATQGILLLGEHGGYIDPTDSTYTGSALVFGPHPTESDGVQLAGSSNVKVPYWWHLKSPNNCEGVCEYESNRPALRDEENSLEHQLDTYIETHLNECINDFSNLKLQGYEITENRERSVETSIAGDDTVVVLTWDLTITRGQTTSDIDQFFARVPVNLRKIYDLATAIANLQQQYRFLEHQTMNLISGFAGLDTEKLPPISELRFEFGSTTSWRKSKVQDDIENILTSYISLFQVDGTRNFNRELYVDSLQQRLYDGMIVPVADPQYEDLDVTFSFLDIWPIHFDLNCNGELCQPESISSNLFALFGMQRYNFAYDISYPTLIEIYDRSALGGKGYKFNFFLESNVRNNEELPTNFQPLKQAGGAGGSQLCDFENRKSGDIELKAVDLSTAEPLADAVITYTVADESCFIGKTNEKGVLVATIPTGSVGGFVTFAKENYLATSQLFDAKKGKRAILEGFLEPIGVKQIIVRKKLFAKTDRGWVFTNTQEDLTDKEDAVISLTRQGELTEQEFTSATTITGSTAKPMRIAPGTYTIDISIISRERIEIPEKTVTKKTGLFSEEEVTFPGLSFDENNLHPAGGAKLTFMLTETDLQSHDTIVFYALQHDLASVPISEREIDDISQVTELEALSQSYQTALFPDLQ